MLNQYIDMLKKATDVLGNLGKSGAGIGDYFHAVGYEFLLLGIGILYIAVIVLVVAFPVLVINQICLKDRFASKKWKQFSNFLNKVENFCKCFNKYQTVLLNTKSKKIFLEKLDGIRQLCKSYGVTTDTSAMSDDEIDKILHTTSDNRYKYLKNRYIPELPVFSNIFLRDFNLFYDWFTDAVGISSFDGELRNEFNAIYPDKKAYKRACFWHSTNKVGIIVLFTAIYLIFVIPLILVLF